MEKGFDALSAGHSRKKQACRQHQCSLLCVITLSCVSLGKLRTCMQCCCLICCHVLGRQNLLHYSLHHIHNNLFQLHCCCEASLTVTSAYPVFTVVPADLFPRNLLQDDMQRFHKTLVAARAIVECADMLCLALQVAAWGFRNPGIFDFQVHCSATASASHVNLLAEHR